MKKAVLALFCLLLLAVPTRVQAQFTYTTNIDGTLTITGCTNAITNLVIPSTINGLTVTTIKPMAFLGFIYVTNITIPNTVTTIGEAAFAQCYSLLSIYIPGSVTNMGFGICGACSSLTNATIADGVTALPATFMDCSDLTGVSVPPSVQILESTFRDCEALTNFTFTSAVTNISDAFEDCTGLTSMVIPGNVTELGKSTFYACTNLTNVVLSNGVCDIGTSAFAYCPIMSITIPETVTNIAGAASSGNDTEGQPFEGCANLTNLTILGSPTIGSYAFYLHPNLNTVHIAGGNIGYAAFELCLGVSQPSGQTIISGLSNVTLGGAVTGIGEFAFFGDPITNLVIPGSVTNFGVDAFNSCWITNLTIMPGVTTIPQEAFLQNPITSLTIPDSVTAILGSAFYACTSLTNVVIPASVTQLGADAFSYCTSLSNILFLGNPPSYAAEAQTGPSFNDGGSSCIIYYLPGATGWPSTYGDDFYFGPNLTALWNPGIQTGGPNFGVSNGQFGFNITNGSTTNLPVVVLACTNLGNPVWTPLTNIILTNTFYFTDTQWSNYPARYYGLGFP